MENIQEKFRTSFNTWSEKDKNQVEEFFLSNVFFSKFYQNKKIEKISRICLYRKLEPNEKILLENNNRAEAVILLSGHVIVKKKEKNFRKKLTLADEEIVEKSQRIRPNQSKSNENEPEETYLAYLKEFNETLTLNTECIVEAPENINSEIIFIPCALYNKLKEDIENERVQKIEEVLERFFFRLKKKELHELSQSNCLFREFKMNNYIYRASSKPEEIFILLEGMVKLEKPGFSQETLREKILINSGMIFGEKDLKLEERTRSAIACTAHVEVLTIPKNQFLKFVPKAFPEMIFDQKNLSLTKLPKVDENPKTSRSMNVSPRGINMILPVISKLNRFHANSFRQETKRSESEERREYELIKNSHMLLDIKSRAKNKFRLQNFSPKSKEEIELMIKKQKSKLKDLKESSRFTIDNSLIRR